MKTPARSTNFFSLHIWSTAGGSDDGWNPGNYEPRVGERVLEAVEEAKKQTPPDSPEREDFDWRAEYIGAAVGRMDDTSSRTWFDYPWPRLEGPAGNTSRVLGSSTGTGIATA